MRFKALLCPAWVNVAPLPSPAVFIPMNLGSGETAAIALALHLHPDLLIPDDGAVRPAASALGLRAIGVLGAKQRGMVTSIREEMNALISASFRVSPGVYRDILARADEL